jgi:AmiR/NasT family two-component response regulator
VTAEAEPAYIAKAIKAGATGYIVKPITAEMLLEIMKEIAAWRAKLALARS